MLAVRVVQVAQDAESHFRLLGKEAALATLRRRAGGMLDAHIVDCCCQHSELLVEAANGASLWEAVLAAEPSPARYLADERLDEALQTIADCVDLKSPYTLGHSRGVAELAAAAARRYGLPEADVIALRRASLLHDLGRIINVRKDHSPSSRIHDNAFTVW